MFLLAVALLCSFIVGFWTGEYWTAVSEAQPSQWNPFQFYRQVSEVQSSPFTAFFPDLWSAARETRHEVVLAGIVTAVAGLAGTYGGSPAARYILEQGGARSRGARMALDTSRALQEMQSHLDQQRMMEQRSNWYQRNQQQSWQEYW